MNIFIGGVNGSGKTTLLQGVNVLRPNWICVKSSHAFMEWLGFPGDYTRLRQLDSKERDLLLVQFMEYIVTVKCSGPLLLDSHYLNMKYGVIESVTGEWISKFEALVLVTAPVETVLGRLNNDTIFRDRALFPENILDVERSKILSQYIAQTEVEFHRLAEKFRLPCKIIENIDKNSAVQELVSFIEGLS